jgi:3-hydroxyacyl-CoA dehydrogenase / enoyl-CoA hydratase / 3-hydroxybutyryl-CoA epimerase
MYIFKAGVVGAGTMGAEIAQVISFSGLPVVLKDVDQGMLDKGMQTIREIYQGRVDKGKMSVGEMENKLSLVEPSLSYDSFEDVDIVIEAVPEKMAIKKAVFKELTGKVPETTIYATNTSALSISELAAATDRPDKVIGMHFFNPAHVMKLVEIIPGLDTTQETTDDVVAFTESLRKVATVVQECPGFLVNRLLMPYLNEATWCLQEGAASATEIDDALVEFGMPMGPFTLMDMLGIDVCAYVGEYLYNEYGPRMTPAPLFYKLVEAGRFGEKAGKGFYGYGAETDEQVKEIVAQFGRQAGSEFCVERVIFPLINEAVLALQEHVATSGDVDMAMIAGTGMSYNGDRSGPLSIADHIGLDVVLKGLEEFQAKYGERFRPAQLLKTYVRAGHLGVKTGRGFMSYA